MTKSEDNKMPDLDRQFGVDPGASGFNAISKEYKANPKIENYVRLRRRFPDKEIEVATTGGIDHLFAEEGKLRALNIEPRLVARCLDANVDAHSELSLKLMELLIQRDQLKRGGATHIARRNLGISDVEVNYLIAGMLDSLSWNDELEISRDLIVLIKHQLRAFTSKFEEEEETRGKRHSATIVACQLIAAGKKPTFRNIAKAIGVNATTVMRWFPDGDFGTDLNQLYQDIMKLRESEKGTVEK
jgi:hypothetical protein